MPPAKEAESPFGSEEGRGFLQERIAWFGRSCFFISAAFWIAGVVIALTISRGGVAGPVVGNAAQLLHLASAMTLLVMWLIARGGPLPAAILRTVDGVGTVVTCVALDVMALGLPVFLRPELISLLGLMVLLLYRAAIVPSDAHRTTWISGLSAAPLPFVTQYIYSDAPLPPGVGGAFAYTIWNILWCALVTVLAGITSRVIFGLRQTVREARRLGQYTLVEKIGEGGMGAVYRARHALLRRPTAIKLLPPERAGQIDLARFEREVQLTSLLTSPNTVSVYDYGRTPDGIFYYAMEYLDGIDLDELVRRDGPMPPGRVAHVLRQVCRALDEAHRVGLIHRDIKPANILLCERGGTPDVAKVVDFGLVKDVGSRDGAGLTVENTVPGTPYYMAPESLTSPDRVDARSDLYSLAATAYFLLSGRVVFEGSTMEVFGHILRTAPVPPAERLGRPLPPKISELVMAGLAKDPGARPESARKFREALDACDDMPRWTEEEAAAWWRTRGPMLRRAITQEAPTPSPPRTLMVDLAEKGG